MNFLAHAYLSFEDPDVLTGNMIADAVVGNKMDDYPPNIKRGIQLHRAIDAFTDQHELVRQTRKIFYPTISHYALVISDVIYDHFLGVNWVKFDKGTLLDFSQRSYSYLDQNISYIPEKFKRIYPYMKADNWFVMYSTLPGIYTTIERLQYRSPRFIWAEETKQIFDQHYAELEQHFLAFFPALIQHSKKYLESI